MIVTGTDAYLAERAAIALLAHQPRPRVPFAAEEIEGALCLWRTNGSGNHVDAVRLDPLHQRPVADVLRGVRASTTRAPRGHVAVRTTEDGIGLDDSELLDHLTASPKSTGYLMARPLSNILDEPVPTCQATRVGPPATQAEYSEMRRMAAVIFGSDPATYHPDADFYSAPKIMTYVAAFTHDQVIGAASILIVDGIANIWSVCTREDTRGQGVASAVTHAGLLEAHRQGAKAAILGTSFELARPGGLYSRLGFAVVGQEYSWLIRDVDTLSLPA